MELRYAQMGFSSQIANVGRSQQQGHASPPAPREQLPVSGGRTLAPIGAAATTAPAYFRSVEAIHVRMRELASAHPELVQLIDLGTTAPEAGGRPLLAMRISAGVSDPATAAKPGAMMVGGVHAREIANPELLMGFAEELVKGYGSDPTSSALLDNRRLIVLPVANPDGHAIIEKGYARQPGGNLMQRINNRPGGGVDINRNFPHHWGEVGSSNKPGSETYRGPSAASEPETRAMMKLVEDEKPGLVLDWHSHGEYVLAPFGHNEVPKDDAGLRAIGANFNRRNGYRVMTSWEFGSGSGTSKDWVYGEKQIPSFTVETGSEFHQSDREYADTVKRNRPVLEQALYMVDAPYERAQGPDAAKVGADVLLTAVQRPKPKGGTAPAAATIVGAELVTDLKAAPGAGVVLAAKDGAFDGAKELVALPSTALLSQSAQSTGYALIRGKDSAGVWGNPVAVAIA